jgi:UDP:flavonoid glycosyltransferase YjiC (YdhE family)
VIGPLVDGVPPVVTSAGADQEENGLQVVRAGVGHMVQLGDGAVDAVRVAASAVLDGDDVRAATQQMAAGIAAMPSADEGVGEIERLTTGRSR